MLNNQILRSIAMNTTQNKMISNPQKNWVLASSRKLQF